jgi:hypothetical protein
MIGNRAISNSRPLRHHKERPKANTKNQLCEHCGGVHNEEPAAEKEEANPHGTFKVQDNVENILQTALAREGGDP